MSHRSISLDQTALSPQEYEAYKQFIDELKEFTSQRDGHLRFAEAAQFLRRWYPFETDREDEIRSFFPQKIQLGEMTQGCVLAILRLLAHIRSQTSQPVSSGGGGFKAFCLYRDLIFTQADPLPPLSQTSSLASTLTSPPPKYKPTIPSSNPFRQLDPSNQTPNHDTTAHPTKLALATQPSVLFQNNNTWGLTQPKSADGIRQDSLPAQLPPKIPRNPFRQRTSPSASTSAQSSRTCSSSTVISPRIPPRPPTTFLDLRSRKIDSFSDEEPVSSDPPPHSLPPPKHFTQRMAQRSADGLGTRLSDRDPSPVQSIIDQGSREQSRGPSSRNTPPGSQPSLPAKISGRHTPGSSFNNESPGLTQFSSAPGSRPLTQYTHPTSQSGSDKSRVRSAEESAGGPPSFFANRTSSCTNIKTSYHTASGPPPLPPTKPARPHTASKIISTKNDHDDPTISPTSYLSEPNATYKNTLNRSQTLNYPKTRNAPPLPPPRKRPESLHIHNPNSVSIDQLVMLEDLEGNSNNTNETSRIRNNNRVVSNSIINQSTIMKIPPRRRSISLYFGKNPTNEGGEDQEEDRNKVKRGEKGNNTKAEEEKSNNLRSKKKKNEGKEIVREISNGIKLSYEKLEERIISHHGIINNYQMFEKYPRQEDQDEDGFREKLIDQRFRFNEEDEDDQSYHDNGWKPLN